MSAEKERKHFVETTGDERGERKKENTLWRPPVMSTEKERKKNFVETTGDEHGERKKENTLWRPPVMSTEKERKKTLCGDHR